jgi:hypothetical protein
MLYSAANPLTVSALFRVEQILHKIKKNLFPFAEFPEALLGEVRE